MWNREFLHSNRGLIVLRFTLAGIVFSTFAMKSYSKIASLNGDLACLHMLISRRLVHHLQRSRLSFWPIDLIGHGLIMAIIVSIAADHTREIHFLPFLKRSLASIPASLATVFIVFVTGYRGLHTAFYGAEGRSETPISSHLTHTPNMEHPDGEQAPQTLGMSHINNWRRGHQK